MREQTDGDAVDRYERRDSYDRTRDRRRYRSKERVRERSRSGERYYDDGDRGNGYDRDRDRSYRRRDSRSRSPVRGKRVTDRDAPEPNVCIGVFGLHGETEERDLSRVFSKYGQIEKIQLVMDRKLGRSRGFGFVYFKDIHDATDARNACNGMELDGRRIRVDYSITKRAHTPTPGRFMGDNTESKTSVRYEPKGFRRSSSYGRESPSYRSRRSPSYSRGDRRRVRSKSRSRSCSP